MKKVLQKPKAERTGSGILYPYPEMNEDSHGNRQTLWPIVFSLIVHLLLVVALIFLPQFSFERSYKPSVINVRMVSLGDLRSDSGAGKALEQKNEMKATADVAQNLSKKTDPEPDAKVKIKPIEPEKKVEIETKPVISPKIEKVKPQVSLAPKDAAKEKPAEKIDAKKSLKKETFKPSEVVRTAIGKLEKETKDTRAESVTDAIAQLRKDVERESSPKRPVDATKSQGGGGDGGSVSGFGGNGAGSGSGEIMEVYRSVIASHIQENWAFSEQLARGQSELETLVGMKIMPSGEIQDIWFDKKSGNPYLDESAMRAVKKSNPLPPLPRDTGRYYMIGLRFTPRGLDG
ncbi:MAG: TonB C-terminal domain-containing protein [Desulfobacterales bacterium]